MRTVRAVGVILSNFLIMTQHKQCRHLPTIDLLLKIVPKQLNSLRKKITPQRIDKAARRYAAMLEKERLTGAKFRAEILESLTMVVTTSVEMYQSTQKKVPLSFLISEVLWSLDNRGLHTKSEERLATAHWKIMHLLIKNNKDNLQLFLECNGSAIAKSHWKQFRKKKGPLKRVLKIVQSHRSELFFNYLKLKKQVKNSSKLNPPIESSGAANDISELDLYVLGKVGPDTSEETSENYPAENCLELNEKAVEAPCQSQFNENSNEAYATPPESPPEIKKFVEKAKTVKHIPEDGKIREISLQRPPEACSKTPLNYELREARCLLRRQSEEFDALIEKARKKNLRRLTK